MVKLNKFEEAALKAKKLQSAFFHPKTMDLKEKKNSNTVFTTDLIDPNLDLPDEEIIRISIPRNVSVDTAIDDETDLPKHTVYETFHDYSGVLKCAKKFFCPEEPLPEEEMEFY